MDKITLKITRAKQLGFAFFIILAIANIVGDMFDGKYKIIDMIFVVITILPFVLNKNWITLSFGVINAFISTFFCIAIYASHPNAGYENTLDPVWPYSIGSMFGTISLTATIFLIYVGFYDQDQPEINKVQSVLIRNMI